MTLLHFKTFSSTESCCSPGLVCSCSSSAHSPLLLVTERLQRRCVVGKGECKSHSFPLQHSQHLMFICQGALSKHCQRVSLNLTYYEGVTKLVFQRVFPHCKFRQHPFANFKTVDADFRAQCLLSMKCWLCKVMKTLCVSVCVSSFFLFATFDCLWSNIYFCRLMQETFPKLMVAAWRDTRGMQVICSRCFERLLFRQSELLWWLHTHSSLAERHFVVHGWTLMVFFFKVEKLQHLMICILLG